jgi:hypothetical protein
VWRWDKKDERLPGVGRLIVNHVYSRNPVHLHRCRPDSGEHPEAVAVLHQETLMAHSQTLLPGSLVLHSVATHLTTNHITHYIYNWPFITEPGCNILLPVDSSNMI